MKSKFEKDQDSLLSTAYQKFEASFDTLDQTPAKKWTALNSLAYICKKYKEKFGFKFVLSYKDSPSKSPEGKLAFRLWMMLGCKAGDGAKVKEYIDYYFHNYTSKTHFVSINALAKEKNVAEFIKVYTEKNKPGRTTPISKIMEIIVKAFPETAYIKTFGDLAFLKQAIQVDKESPEVYSIMFESMESSGIDLSVLDEIK